MLPRCPGWTGGSSWAHVRGRFFEATKAFYLADVR